MLAIDFLDRLCRCSYRTLRQRDAVAAMERESIELDLRFYRSPRIFILHILYLLDSDRYLNDLYVDICTLLVDYLFSLPTPNIIKASAMEAVGPGPMH